MKLTTLKPRLATLNTNRLKPQTFEAGQRPAGRNWQKTRERVALAYGYRCVDCDRIWRPHRDHIDHDVPRWKGGSDEDSNLRPRCLECHDAKTKVEAAERARAGA